MGGLADNLAFGIVSLREQKHLQKAEEKIQMLANVVESSDDAIITKSLDGTITSWNKGAEVVYGYSEEEVLGKNISILAPPQLKDELKHLTEKIEAGEHGTFKGNTPYSHNNLLVRLNNIKGTVLM